MTKKHFINLADRIANGNLCDLTATQIEALADFCEDCNPRFNRERWLTYIGKCSARRGTGGRL